MKPRDLLNLNMLGVLFLVGAFVVSLGRVMSISRAQSEQTGVRLMLAHWQLEPGYRQAMEWAIKEYEKLPHVQQAGVRIKQEPITEKVYKQWLNTHLMSGTAPDICEKGMARMAGGEFTAKYFEPLGSYAEEPNPYNTPESLPAGLSPQRVKTLTQRPWRETFIDGMKGGWDDTLQNYYALPTSFWGGLRIYFNRKLVDAAQALIADALAAGQTPAWMSDFLAKGYVTDASSLRQWAAARQSMDTLGRLLAVCVAVRAIGVQSGNSKLVPIAGSSYSVNMFEARYRLPFTYQYADRLDMDSSNSVSGLETAVGFQNGLISFDDPRMQAYFECIQTLAEQFPAGFVALERDQAVNRFVLGNAAMIASGAWDAAGIYFGAANRTRAEDRFEVAIINFPLPGPGEKWSQYCGLRASEATASGGAPYAVSQRTRHKKWAIDFLRFFGSFAVNQEFNRRAGWIPVILGTQPLESMVPFVPETAGVHGSLGIEFYMAGGNITNVYYGQMWLLLSGDLTYQQFSQRMEETIADPRNGVIRVWDTEYIKARNAARNHERSLSVQDVRALILGADDADAKHRRVMVNSVKSNNGRNYELLWHRLHPDQPFPEF